LVLAEERRGRDPLAEALEARREEERSQVGPRPCPLSPVLRADGQRVPRHRGERIDQLELAPLSVGLRREDGDVEIRRRWRRILTAKIPPPLTVPCVELPPAEDRLVIGDRKSTRLNSSHVSISYAVFCLQKQLLRLSLA